MLSVAQAVHHPETPGSGSKRTVLGHSWSSERPTMLKRRKTDSDCYISDKKSSKNSIETLKKQLKINNQEITLTVISKSNNENDRYEELLYNKIKTSPINEKEVNSDKIGEEKKDSDRIPTNLPPVVRSLLENSEEIQLTKLGSSEILKLSNQNQMCNDNITSKKIESNIPQDNNKPSDNSKQKKNFLELNSISELTEVTIEPCSSFQKSKIISTSSDISKQPCTKMATRLEKANELLKTSKQTKKTFATSNINKTFDKCLKESKIKTDENYSIDNKSEIVETDSEQDFDKVTYITTDSSLFDELPDRNAPTSSISDYEPFNVGISCDCFYSNDKDKPYYTTGFPNPPGENRCWTNATLQALFALPIINKLDSIDTSNCSKLISLLINIQSSWRKGITGDRSFNQLFCSFKEELSALDKLYCSKAQQDVSEFIMNLLNFIKSEFETKLTKESHSNEIENIPNNEQDELRKTQNSVQDINKRLPLADISATQFRNSHSVACNGQQEALSFKASPSVIKFQNEERKNINPIDDYFSLHMIENYICDGCSKSRQQKVENLMLFIDLPSEDHGNTTNLLDMINMTYALEHRNMTCESCKHDVHSMLTKFKKLPKILIFQVKRYEITNDGTITKKSTLVEIPKILKLDSLVINNSQEFTHFPKYEPVCIISHIGDNIDSGHYISFVKHQEQWFYYDDMNVKLLSFDEVFKCVQNNAYVIFFQDTELSQHTDIVN